MKYLRILLVIIAAIGMTSWATVTMQAASPQGQSTALERGYRTGYSDGYNAGYRDVSNQAARNHQANDDFQQADRNYNQAWGPVEDYRDGYQQGFETGYAAGYDREPFNSSIPTGLARRSGTTDAGSAAADNTQSADDTTGISSVQTVGSVSLPRESVLLVELQSSLSTDATQQGDRFEARVLEPRELAGSIVQGRVIRVKRPGKVSGAGELQLAFESIRTPDNRTSSFSAQVIEVMNTGHSDESGEVDNEGGVRGKSTTKDDVSKVGASTGIGAIIGAIAGGGKGAAIGAAIGGSIGTAGVLSQRGNDLRLPQGQLLRIRTATETRVQ
ncbi:MAG TPA: hypothetical protein VJV03_03570 [Pyrinomonadaceae bacterium]|nr:hypothetical protein [Pyrinomonadaceae bacterium]